jgi:chemotaxis protein methyltransferase CheR
VRFEKHNLISDPGLKFMDVIFCRNVMIYFKKEQQELLMKKFHDVLNPGGYLVIAKVESIWDKSLFAPVDLIRKIYRKV